MPNEIVWMGLAQGPSQRSTTEWKYILLSSHPSIRNKCFLWFFFRPPPYFCVYLIFFVFFLLLFLVLQAIFGKFVLRSSYIFTHLLYFNGIGRANQQS